MLPQNRRSNREPQHLGTRLCLETGSAKRGPKRGHRGGPYPSDWRPYKKSSGRRHTQRGGRVRARGGDGHLKTRERGSGKPNPQHLDLGLLASRAGREQIYVASAARTVLLCYDGLASDHRPSSKPAHTRRPRRFWKTAQELPRQAPVWPIVSILLLSNLFFAGDTYFSPSKIVPGMINK